jgi:hypothetical protein
VVVVVVAAGACVVEEELLSQAEITASTAVNATNLRAKPCPLDTNFIVISHLLEVATTIISKC